MEVFIAIVAVLCGIIGIIGSIAPALPGPPISWVGMLILYFWGGTNGAGETMSLSILLIWLAIVILVTILDYVVPAYFTKLTGGSKYASIGTTVGLIAGLFIPPVGMILGSLLGAFIAELIFAGKSAGPAVKSAFGAFLGFRETRRVVGDYVLSNEDYERRATFKDEIGRYCYPIDLHPVAPGAAKTKYEENYLKGYGLGNSYGIPYRSLIPKGVSNLLVAGRCISTSREMNGSTRVMPCCFITGMAAGAAAFFAKDSSTRDIDVPALQRKLKEMGAYLPNAEI